MPSPSKFRLFTALIFTGGVFLGGGWLAAELKSDAPDESAPAQSGGDTPTSLGALSSRKRALKKNTSERETSLSSLRIRDQLPYNSS